MIKYYVNSFQNSSNEIFLFLAKAFPGNLQLPTEKYDVNMKDHTSEAFKNTAKKITDEVSNH